MKKLSLLLFAVCISVIGWAYNPDSDWKHSNPFAYGLSARLSDDHSKLYLTYSLNATAVNSTDFNSNLGVQIRIINKATNATVKTIADGSIKIQRGTWTHEVSTDGLPRDTELTFEVIVNGNAKRTKPQIIGSSNPNNKGKNPINAHGIGINTDPTHPNFGQRILSLNLILSYSMYNAMLKQNTFKHLHTLMILAIFQVV